MKKTEWIRHRWQKVHELFRTNTKFVISTHINPDGDAVGSCLALHHLFLKLGKESRVIAPSPIPNEYKFLGGDHHFEVYNEEMHDFIGTADVAVILDIGNPLRLKRVWEIIRERKIPSVCLDHHPANSVKFDYEIIDTSVPATGFLLWEYINHYYPALFDLQIAEALYTALMTDTGSFRFENSTKEAHVMAVDLLSKGVRPDKIYRAVYENDSETRLKLLGRVLTDFHLEAGGKVAWFQITRDLLTSLNACHDDVEGFTDFLRRLKGLEISIMFLEMDNNRTRVNFRSKGKYAVNTLAAEFGGGGHPCAAGCVIELPLNLTINTVLEKAYTLINN